MCHASLEKGNSVLFLLQVAQRRQRGKFAVGKFLGCDGLEVKIGKEKELDAKFI